MKLIPLTQGKFAKVDDEDYDYLMQWKWFAHYNKSGDTWYAQRKKHLGGSRANQQSVILSMHRVIMNTPPELFCDHIFGDGLDNQKINLRNCTRQQNNSNRRKKVGKLKYKGVDKRSENSYRARLRLNSKQIILGHFKTEIEAALAYNQGALKYFGEYSNLNIIL